MCGIPGNVISAQFLELHITTKVRSVFFVQRIKDPDVWKPFLIVNGTFILQVWTGFAIMRGYLIVILESSGSRLSPYDVALLSRVFTVLGQLSCTFINRQLVKVYFTVFTALFINFHDTSINKQLVKIYFLQFLQNCVSIFMIP